MTAASPVTAGDVLGDRYVLRKIAWETALGPMWSARDRVLDRPVFVQLLSARAASVATVRRAFQRSAAGIAQVTHPGIVQVFDIGDDPPFVVYEHTAGGRLSDRLRSGPMRTADAAKAALALARALEALHERGAYHGVLGPELVLFDEEGRAKILALGTADASRAARVAPAGKIVSFADEQPASYRPPEGDGDEAAADRYALAALTFHMLTGKEPSGRPARTERRSIPEGIDALLGRALSSDPAERPTLDGFVGALAPFVRVVPKDARERPPSPGEFRWLVPVAILVVIAALAATFGVKIARDLTTPTKPKASTSAPAAQGEALPIQTVLDFDPLGNNEESPDEVKYVTDGDPATAWRSLCYASASFGGKAGVGLLFDLGVARRLGAVRIRTDLPGWSGEIRVARRDGERPQDFTSVRSFTAESDQTLALPAGTTDRYVLLWITKAVDYPGQCQYPFRVSVGEVAFFA